MSENPPNPKISHPVVLSFNWTEHFAHFVAYEALQRGEFSEITVTDEDQQQRQYRARKLTTEDKGMVCEILFPMNPSFTELNVLYISFTGTHSKETFMADFQRAPGEESFREVELDLFLNIINSEVEHLFKTTQQKVNLVLIGHSLGGAYAQLGFHSLQRAIAANVYSDQPNASWPKLDQAFRCALKSPFEHTKHTIPRYFRQHLLPKTIASITLGVWNSEGVLRVIEANSNALAPLVQMTGIKQRVFFGLVQDDVVQGIGQGTVLNNVDRQHAEIHLVKIDRRQEMLNRKNSHQLTSAATPATLGAPGLFATIFLTFMEKKEIHSTPTLNIIKEKVAAESFDVKSLALAYYQNDTPEGQQAIYQCLLKSKTFNTWFAELVRVTSLSLFNFIYITLPRWKQNRHRNKKSPIDLKHQ